jgi:hypothetical protein
LAVLVQLSGRPSALASTSKPWLASRFGDPVTHSADPLSVEVDNPVANAAAADLNGFGADFKGAKDTNGQVTPRVLFRGLTAGDAAGPYLSQFFYQPCHFGANEINQKIRTVRGTADGGADYMTDFASWLSIQNGVPPSSGDIFDPTARYMRNGRDIGQWVHIDVLFQAYFQAFLVIAGLGVPADAGNPYRDSATQIGFGTFGGPHIATLFVVTCVLLVGSLLQLRSITKQQTIDYGYDTDGVISARMGLMDGDYPTPDARKVFYERVLQEFEGDARFEAVALSNRFRMVFSGNGPVEIEGKTYRENRDRPNANFEQVSGGYFAVTGQRMLEGRTFTTADLDARQPVAIVNSAFAAKHFPGESALGRRFRTVAANGRQPGPWRTIVGVVSMVRMLGPFNIPNVDETGFYVPFFSNPFGPIQPTPFVSQFTTIIAKPRPGQRADAMAVPLRQEIMKVDPNLPLYYVGTARHQLESFVAQNRIIATMFTIFGAVAIVLASVGMYGVMSFSVNQRRQEFGVRMALGAHYNRILRMVLKQGAMQLALGLLIGVGLALTLATLAGSGIQTVLFGVSARDPLTYAVVIGVITVVSLMATLVPARRATRVDPMIALRAE